MVKENKELDYNVNYHLQGRYVDGSEYFEHMSCDLDAWLEIADICAAWEEFIKMGSPKAHAGQVVQPIGLQLVHEIDSTYCRKELSE